MAIFPEEEIFNDEDVGIPSCKLDERADAAESGGWGGNVVPLPSPLFAAATLGMISLDAEQAVKTGLILDKNFEDDEPTFVPATRRDLALLDASPKTLPTAGRRVSFAERCVSPSDSASTTADTEGELQAQVQVEMLPRLIAVPSPSPVAPAADVAAGACAPVLLEAPTAPRVTPHCSVDAMPADAAAGPSVKLAELSAAPAVESNRNAAASKRSRRTLQTSPKAKPQSSVKQLSTEELRLAKKAEKLKDIGIRMAAVMEDAKVPTKGGGTLEKVILQPESALRRVAEKPPYVSPALRPARGTRASSLPSDYATCLRGTHLTDTHAIDVEDPGWSRLLTPSQYSVLRDKATEPGGQFMFPLGFDDHFERGVYICAGCAAASKETVLYTSDMKFECGCGWPGFWCNVKGAVLEVPDQDGSRCELLCCRCEGHLGHVFRGEGWDRRKGFAIDERHCVNSLSLLFMRRSGGKHVIPQWTGDLST